MIFMIAFALANHFGWLSGLKQSWKAWVFAVWFLMVSVTFFVFVYAAYLSEQA
jgi:hypothetical protein